MQQKTMRVVEDDWKSSDETVVRRKRWIPEGPVRAWVIALHGLNCWVDDFAPLAEPLTSQGFALVAWNLRGQGLDPVEKRRGAWLDRNGMVGDVKRMLAEPEILSGPVFLLGESMGALLAIRAAIDPAVAATMRGLLLLVPVSTLAQKNPLWVKKGLRFLSRQFPALRVNPSWLVHRKSTTPLLTRDPVRQERFEAAPHRMHRLAPVFLCEMGDLIEGTREATRQLHVPVAMFTAGHDAFVKPEDSKGLFREIASDDKTHFHYPEAYHQMLHDLDSASVMRDMTAWIAARMWPSCKAV